MQAKKVESHTCPLVTTFLPKTSGSHVTCPGKRKIQILMGIKGSDLSTLVYKLGKKLQLKHMKGKWFIFESDVVESVSFPTLPM